MSRAAASLNSPILSGTGLTPAQLLKRTVLTLALFAAVGPLMGGLLGGWVMFAYLGYLAAANKPVFESFHSQHATEWLLGLGFSRRALAIRHMSAMALRSLVHTAGFVLLVNVFLFFNRAPAEESWLGTVNLWTFPGHFFVCHLIIQCVLAMFQHLECCTWIPPRWRDVARGSRVSLPWYVSAFVALLAIGALLVCFPFYLYSAVVFLPNGFWGQGPTFWLAWTAAAYLALVFAMVAASEASRRTKSGLRFLPASPGSPGRTNPFRTTPHRYAPMMALCWNGLEPSVKQSFWLYPLIFAVALGIAISFAGMDSFHADARGMTWRLLKGGVVFSVGIQVSSFLILGSKLLQWRPVGPAAEYLFTRGIPLGTLRKTSLLSGLLVTGLVFAFSLATLWMFDSLSLLNHLGQQYWGVLLVPTGLLLLSVNDVPIGWRAVRARNLGTLLLALIPVLLVLTPFLVALLGATGHLSYLVILTTTQFWNGAGLAVFVPALVLWFKGWMSCANEQRLRWDTWEA